MGLQISERVVVLPHSSARRRMMDDEADERPRLSPKTRSLQLEVLKSYTLNLEVHG